MLLKMKAKLKVYSDGASRGNPGPSAIAFVVLTEDGKILKKYSKYVGMKTNNQAEYEALINALEFVSSLTNQEVVCYIDSELVVKHLNRDYQVRDPKLKPLWLKANELVNCFSKVAFVHVPRTDAYIQEVDCLVNQTLDRISGCS
jgi:ribonuclease HI